MSLQIPGPWSFGLIVGPGAGAPVNPAPTSWPRAWPCRLSAYDAPIGAPVERAVWPIKVRRFDRPPRGPSLVWTAPRRVSLYEAGISEVVLASRPLIYPATAARFGAVAILPTAGAGPIWTLPYRLFEAGITQTPLATRPRLFPFRAARFAIVEYTPPVPPPPEVWALPLLRYLDGRSFGRTPYHPSLFTLSPFNTLTGVR